MRKLIVFNHVSLDGHFTDKNGDMNFAQNPVPDAEWDSFVGSNAGGGMLVFGRVTYELMENFWPTPFAAESMPEIAKQMNALPKVVFSRTLDKVTWNNSRLIKDDLIGEIAKLKQAEGDDMVIFGSGTIVSQLTKAGLIDEYQIIVDPVALGGGRTMFDGIQEKLSMKLLQSRTFDNGNVLLCYMPINSVNHESRKGPRQ
jgi:dihydrofolate reductase